MHVNSDKLPEPSPEERRHYERVLAEIQRMIDKSGGNLRFGDYMDTVLHRPGLGYYASGSEKFGAGGDFTTAPELGELFGRCMARQVHQVLQHLKGGAVLEVGAGSGQLCAQILLALAECDGLPERYYILETSAELAHRQRRLLESAGVSLERVQWLDSLDGFSMTGVIVANELLDAMAVDRFVVVDGEARIMGVTASENALEWCLMPECEAQLAADRVVARYSLTEGYMSEINPRAESFVRALSGCVRSGVVLLIDYGYGGAEFYHAQRNSGTLRCHFRHHAHNDPLVYCGIQDITSHIDFTSVAEAAVSTGFEVAGYVNQASFLMNLALDQEIYRAAQTGVDQMKLANEVKRLTLPSEMGEVFKVLALAKDYSGPLDSCRQGDRRHTLGM